MRSMIVLIGLLTHFAPAPALAGAEEPSPEVAWSHVGAVGVHRLYYEYLYLPVRPRELPETLQVAIFNRRDSRSPQRIATVRPCCARRVTNEELFFPGVDDQLSHVWRVRLRADSGEVLSEGESGIAIIGKAFVQRADGRLEVDLQGDGRPEIAGGCVTGEGVSIYLSESSDPIAEDPKPLWDLYWYLGYDTEPTCPWLQ
jgi:hypothetical protein